MKNIAVIGSNGMLGSDLVSYLSSINSITGINRDNYSNLIGSTFDCIINANGNSKRFWANKHVLEDFTRSTISVYKTIVDFTCKIYIYISSSDVYENHTSSEFTLENQSINPDNVSAYGLHKYLSECIVRNHNKYYLILRSSMILGKNHKKGPIYDILHKHPLYITRESKLQLITTKEVARIIDFLLTNKISREIFNMGGKGAVSFKNIDAKVRMPVTFMKKIEKQEYEMSVAKLGKIYPLETSTNYLVEFLNNP